MNDSSSTQPMGRLERVLMPLATSVGRNKYLLTVRDSFAMIMPLLIIGSMFTLVANFPIPAWGDLLQSVEVGDYTLKELIGIPSNATMGLMGVFIAYNVGYNLAGHEGISDRASASIVSLSSWLILMPQVTPFTPEGATEPLLVDALPLGCPVPGGRVRRGDVLVVNDNLAHYRGEVEVALRDFDDDGTRNVVGTIPDEEKFLLDYVLPDFRFGFILG